jgi:hypothetical protein
MLYVFDLDGTLCDLSHRLHFIERSPKDWSSFYKACVNDSPIMEVIEIAHLLQNVGHVIAIVSGRSDEVESETSRWLQDHRINYDFLLMRKAGDYRQDYIVKSELLDELIKRWPKPIGGIFEDRKQVVDMYRARGLRVFQVAEGNF